MNSKKSLVMLFAMVFVLSMFLSACSSSTHPSSGDKTKTSEDTSKGDDSNKGGSEELADEQVLNLTAADDARSLDSSKSTDTESGRIIENTQVGLLSYNEKEEIVPELAAEMPKANDDKTVYTFKLRDGLKWSDGSPITADQFVYAWRRGVNPDTQSQYAYIFESAHIKNADKIMDEKSKLYKKTEKLGVEAVDDHTLKVTLNQSTPEQYFESLMQFAPFFPLNKDFVEKQGDNYAKEPENLLANGPFKLETWDHGKGWTLVKNDKYWDADHVTLEKVTYKIVKDPKTDLKLYEAGKIDYTGLVAEDVDKYKDSKEFQKTPTPTVFYWDLNRLKRKEFKNENLRKAMWLAMDRESAAKVILNNGSIGANYLVPRDFATGPDGKDFHETGAANLDNYPNTDKAKAKKYWEKAKKELGIKDLTVEFLTTDGELSENLSEYFTNQITKTLDGFHIKIDKVPFKTYLDRAQKGQCDICAGSGWSPDYEDPMTFLELFKTGNGQNTYGVSDKKYDALLDKADKNGANPEVRWKALQEADKYFADHAMAIPTYQRGTATLYKSYVKGAVLHKKGVDIDNYYWHAKILKH